MELTQLLQILRNRWGAALLSFLAVIGLGVAAAFVPTERYTATTTILAVPNRDAVEFGQVQIVEFVVPSLVRKVESDPFRDVVEAELPPSLANVDYEVSAGNEAGTGNFEISVESTNRGAVARIANTYAGALLQDNPSPAILTLQSIVAATRPTSPSAPNRQVILLGAGVLALAAAVLVPLLANALHRRLGGAEEIRKRFGTSVLGVLPKLKRSVVADGTASAVLHDASNPATTEAFHRLRTNLELALLGNEPRAITVTSLHTGEGKSTVAATLGWSLASAGNRVTLVDADLRRPSLHLKLGEPFGPGLAGSMDGHMGPNLALVPTNMPNLDFLPAGTPDRHPAEVVTVALPRVIDELERLRRLVLVDSPPLNGVAETNLIAAMTGAVILVVDARRYDEQTLEKAMYQLHEAGTKVIGVVINRAKLSREQRQLHDYYAATPYRAPERKTPGTPSHQSQP